MGFLSPAHTQPGPLGCLCLSLSPHCTLPRPCPVLSTPSNVWDCQCLPTAHCPGLVQSCPHSCNTCIGQLVSPHCTLPRPCPVLSTLLQHLYGTASVSPLYTAQALSSPVHTPSNVWDCQCLPTVHCPGLVHTPATPVWDCRCLPTVPCPVLSMLLQHLYGIPAAHPTLHIQGKYNTILLAGKEKRKNDTAPD